MELREHPVRKFMPKFERHEPLILDSYAAKHAKMCKRKFFFAIVLARQPREKKVYFTFGGAYHKFREYLELSYQGNNEYYDTPNKEGDFVGALMKALKFWDKEQGMDPPLEDKFSFMTRARLMQSCTVGYDYWKEEKRKGKIEVLAVEQAFNVELTPKDEDGNIISTGEFTSGRFDQIIRWNGQIWGRDFKTSSQDGMYYQRGLSPNDQFTRYTYAEAKLSGERVQGQLVETLYNAKSTKAEEKSGKTRGPTITQYPVARTSFELEDWEAGELALREELKLARTNDVWPKNEEHCTFCIFHSVCKMGSMAAQQSKLEYEFVVRPWDNTKVGVDD